VSVGQFAQQLVIDATRRAPRLSLGLLCRVCLVGVFVWVAHLFQWNWFRFVTSESVLTLSTLLGMSASRITFDTIRVHGETYQFVTACTFVDVFMGSVPLIWRIGDSILKNMARVIMAAPLLFAFNLARLEMGQVLYSTGALSYIWADDVVGGFAYFAVFYALWSQRRWCT